MSERSPEVDDFYDKTFSDHLGGLKFSSLTPEQRAKADWYLDLVSKAKAPDSYPGAATAKATLEKVGGIDAKTARQLSIYSAYKAQDRPMDEAYLNKVGVKLAPDKLEEYRQKWVNDNLSKFNELVKVDRKTAVRSDKEERKIEMAPMSVKAGKTPKAQPPMAAAPPTPKLPEGGPASAPASAPASQSAQEVQPMPLGPPQPTLATNSGNWTRKQLNPVTGEYESS